MTNTSAYLGLLRLRPSLLRLRPKRSYAAGFTTTPFDKLRTSRSLQVTND
ncbi:MAG: hypothetical protein V7L20_14735 [Nostoc sp.]